MSKLKLIQCGVGGHGGGWVRDSTSQSPDFDLVAMVDPNDKALGDAGDAVGVASDRRFHSLQDALDDIPADAVLTVTPPAVHVEHAKLAFARGLHLMTEKPLADTLDNARLMLALARDAGRQLVVSQNYRYTPPMVRLQSLLKERPVGALGHGHLDFHIPADFTGSFRETMRHVLLVDMAIHHLDLIRALTGRNIVRVFARTFKPAWSWYQHNPGLKMMLELEGGIPFSYSGDWSARGRNTTWNGTWRIQCDRGSIHLENDQISIARSSRGFKDDTVIEPIDIPPVERSAQLHLLHLFAAAIRTGTPAETSGEDNLQSFAATMAAVASAETRQEVAVAID